MLIFYGASQAPYGDEAVWRAAKLGYLKSHFKEANPPRAINLLNDGDLALAPSGRGGETLIINAHGNEIAFQGFTADQLFTLLRSKGLASTRWQAIYLIACNVGLQPQDNSVATTFARDFNYLVQTTPATSGIKVYAPRGIVTYTGQLKQLGSGQQTIEITSAVITTPERNYPFAEGILLQA